WHELGVRKHIFIDELIALPQPAADALSDAVGLTRRAKVDLAVIEKKPRGLERLKCAREIRRLLILGDVLGDADGADFVEARINGQIAEVHHLDSAPVAQSSLRDVLLGIVRLCGAQSDA